MLYLKIGMVFGNGENYTENIFSFDVMFVYIVYGIAQTEDERKVKKKIWRRRAISFVLGVLCHFPDKQILMDMGWMMMKKKLLYFLYLCIITKQRDPFLFCFIGTYESIVPVIQFFKKNINFAFGK